MRSGRLCAAPVERGAIDPNAVKDDGDLAGNGDLRLFHTYSLCELHSPGLEGGPFFGPIKQNGRRLEQVSSEKPVAPSRYLATCVSFPRLIAPRCKAEIGADCRDRSEAGRVIDRIRNVRAVTTPTPGTVIRRRVVSSDFAKRRTSSHSYRHTATYSGTTASAQGWFAGGERVGYDPGAHAIVAAQGAPLNIFLRREGDLAHAVSFLPGFPDGSFGWAKVQPHLPSAVDMPKLFVGYVGMGDSDKPKDYAYSTAERTDLLEAIWRDISVRSTTLVAFDFSSLVVLEHLRRRLERSERGEPVGGPDIRGVFIFNGGLFTDGHSHPWYTTPILRRLPARARQRVGRSFTLFKMMVGAMWSKGHQVTDAVIRELSRRPGSPRWLVLPRGRSGLRCRSQSARRSARLWPPLQGLSRPVPVPRRRQ
jgi:pimeloyl-ACP methyl ester carboxylesterase